MRLRGSVLIVVLGLLAILAVVGVTFVTMSSLDHSTATNFALETQFMLAADGAIDYASHHMVQDVWQYDPIKKKWGIGTNKIASQTGPNTPLLLPMRNSGNRTNHLRGVNNGLVRCEPYDYPGLDVTHTIDTVTTGGSAPDPWLATPWEGSEKTFNPPFYSYQHSTYNPGANGPYGIANWLNPTIFPLDNPNNLGIPTGNVADVYTPANGVWIPDISFPFEGGIIRVSITVIDHNGMINVNAHGNVGASSNLAGARGQGYFLSDVNPNVFLTGNPFDDNLLENRTGGTFKPGNANQLETLSENPDPKLGGDRPFTLDEEFELRRLAGTAWTSRLETIVPTLLAPASSYSALLLEKRMGITTFGWTAEVRGDGISPYPGNESPVVHSSPDNYRSIGGTVGGNSDSRSALYNKNLEYSLRKVDVNLDDVEVVHRAMIDGAALASTDNAAKQFCANLHAFRQATKEARHGFESVTIGGGYEATGNITSMGTKYVGAARQPIFSRLKATKNAKSCWVVEVEIYNPWKGDCVGFDTLTTGAMTITASLGSGFTLAPSPDTTGTDSTNGFPASMKQHIMHKAKFTSTPSTGSFNTAFKGFRLDLPNVDTKTVPLDEIGLMNGSDNISIGALEMYRPIKVVQDKRGNDDPVGEAVDVLYMGGWKAGSLGGGFNAIPDEMPSVKIPIRFPRSVPADYYQASYTKISGSLPPRAVMSGGPFRAIARLGDLNQVLWWTYAAPTGNYWWDKPWTTRVTKIATSAQMEETLPLKFNWKDTSEPNPLIPTTISRMYAANVLTAGGPWIDKLDNDGDGSRDDDTTSGYTKPDVGKYGKGGRFAGPELRVAGKINLNTARSATLRALEKGIIDNATGTTDDVIAKAVKEFRTQKKPILTPVQLLSSTTAAGAKALKPVTTDPDVVGVIEQRDYHWTRMSNIVTVRSDTFSIYGTVQFVDPVIYAMAGTDPTKRNQAVKRSRRFWALVDRSPALAFTPFGEAENPAPPGFGIAPNLFLHPRVVNFQWLD